MPDLSPDLSRRVPVFPRFGLISSSPEIQGPTSTLGCVRYLACEGPDEGQQSVTLIC